MSALLKKTCKRFPTLTLAMIFTALLAAGYFLLPVLAQTYQGKFSVKDKNGDAVAVFHTSGDLTLKGTLTESVGTFNASRAGATSIKDEDGDILAQVVIEDSGSPVGDLEILGTVTTGTAINGDMAWCVRDVNGAKVAGLDASGNLYLTGKVFEEINDPSKHPPQWSSDPIILSDAVMGDSYLQDLAVYATDEDGSGDDLTIELEHLAEEGQWLEADASGNGVISGTPPPGDADEYGWQSIWSARVTDSYGMSKSALVQLFVKSQCPTVNAGADLILADGDDAYLFGIAVDDGLPTALDVSWSKFSGPGTVIFADDSAAVTTASFSTTGVYVLELEAYDGEWTISDTVEVELMTPPVVDPSEIDMQVPTQVEEAFEFLYTDENAVQQDVDEDVIITTCSAVIRGRILDETGEVLPGVIVTVPNHAEYGWTMTQADGWYDMMVNGGGYVTLRFEKSGYLPAERKPYVEWNDYTAVDDVMLLRNDSDSTLVDLTTTDTWQTVIGDWNTDDNGTRRQVLLIPPEITSATLIQADGVTSMMVTQLHLRVREYTVGTSGPLAMPADLPPASAYTNCVEFLADEAVSYGAVRTEFSSPVFFYQDNYYDFEVGSIIPYGTYDFSKNAWIPEPDGLVVKITGITTGGLAELDIDGEDEDPEAETAEELWAWGIGEAEREQLTVLYPDAATTTVELWRVQTNHISPKDWNCTNIPRPEIQAEILELRAKGLTKAEITEELAKWRLNGGIIDPLHQTYGESVKLAGIDGSLTYASQRMNSYKAANEMDITILSEEPSEKLQFIDSEIVIAGQIIRKRWPRSELLSCSEENPIIYHFEWDGKDAYGRLVQGRQKAKVDITYAFMTNFASLLGKTVFEGSGSGGGGTVSTSFAKSYIEGKTSMSLGDSFFYYHQRFSVDLGLFSSINQGFGGWALDFCHNYYPKSNMLYRGDGSVERAYALNLDEELYVDRIASYTPKAYNGCWNSQGVNDAIQGPDGFYYFSRNHCISKYNAKTQTGEVICGALYSGGTAVSGDDGEGVAAKDAKVNNPTDMEFGPDGSLYFCDAGNWMVRRLYPDSNGVISGNSIIRTVAGVRGEHIHMVLAQSYTGYPSYSGYPDNYLYIPGDEAIIGRPMAIDIGPDGFLYILETYCYDGSLFNAVIRRVSPDGRTDIILYELTEVITDIALGPDGAIYYAIGDYPVARLIKRLDVDGSVTTVAGGGSPSDGVGDGLDATEAAFTAVPWLEVDQYNNIYLYDSKYQILGNNPVQWYNGISVGHYRLRKIEPNGIIQTLAGDDYTAVYPDDDYPTNSGDDGAALDARMFKIYGMSLTPNGNIVLANYSSESTSSNPYYIGGVRVFKQSEALEQDGKFIYPSEDGSVFYVFDERGVHLRTVDFLTGRTLLEFEYTNGFLTKWTNVYGQETNITRVNNIATKITGPYGHETTLGYDGNGYLNTITGPDGESYTATYNADGGMLTFAYPDGATFSSQYDLDGLLTDHTDEENGEMEFSRVALTDGHAVVVTDSQDRPTTYAEFQAYTEKYIGGVMLHRVVTTPGDLSTTEVFTANGRVYTDYPDGSTSFAKKQVHPFWKCLAKYINRSISTLPSGKYIDTTVEYDDFAMRDEDDAFSGIDSYAITKTLIGEYTDWTTEFERDDNGTPFDTEDDTFFTTATTPEGRVSCAKLDSYGRLSESWIPGFGKTLYQYDSVGRLQFVTQQGDPADETDDRVTEYDYYDATGYIYNGILESITGPTDLEVSYEYDEDGNITTKTLANGKQLHYDYDLSGKVIGLSTPGGNSFSFEYNKTWLPTGYLLPEVNGETLQSTATFNNERAVTSIIAPDGSEMTFDYESATGLLSSWTTDDGGFAIQYDEVDRPTTYSAPLDRGSIVYSYDGSLVKTVTLQDNDIATGSLTYTYFNNTLRMQSLKITDADPVYFSYDDDGLLSQLSCATGTLTLDRDEAAGIVTTSTIGQIETVYDYSMFGELTSDTTTSGSQTIYDNQYSRDKLGQITAKVEARWDDTQQQDVITTYAYQYGDDGRLEQVSINNAWNATYTYDVEGNRIKKEKSGASDALYKYNAHNQLIESGDGSTSTTYVYDKLGRLINKTDPSDATTTYTYDAQSNLIAVLAKDDQGTTITDVQYLLDPVGRRIGRKVNGTLTNRWFYSKLLAPAAELDADGEIQKLYVYLSRPNIPDFIVDYDDGQVYRVITDQVGSLRMVVDIATGEIKQERRYDEYGVLLYDSDPDFTPFGYAGGLYDPETELVHFGAREYDPELGRWLRADPVGFNGGLNWYEYCNGDPINFGDPLGWGPSGEWFFGLGTAGELRDFVLDWWGHALPENWFGHIAFGMISVGTSPLSIGQQTAYASVNYDIQPWYTTAFQIGGDVAEAAGLAVGLFKAAKGIGSLFKAGSGASAAAVESETTAIGRVKDLQNLKKGERSLLDRLPDQGSPKANWKQNSSVLRQEMAKGQPIRDVSPGDTAGQFLNAERNLLKNHGWTFDPRTNYWMPPTQ